MQTISCHFITVTETGVSVLAEDAFQEIIGVSTINFSSDETFYGSDASLQSFFSKVLKYEFHRKMSHSSKNDMHVFWCQFV